MVQDTRSKVYQAYMKSKEVNVCYRKVYLRPVIYYKLAFQFLPSLDET